MLNPQLRVIRIICAILSKKEDTKICGKRNSRAVQVACPQSGKS
jgi:hypothetical protein